jgi:hypothetical protein
MARAGSPPTAAAGRRSPPDPASSGRQIRRLGRGLDHLADHRQVDRGGETLKLFEDSGAVVTGTLADGRLSIGAIEERAFHTAH